MDTSRHHKLTPIDENHLLYGNFIGLQYVFETPLNVGGLHQAVETLQGQFPALSSVYKARDLRAEILPKPQKLKHVHHAGALRDILRADRRPDFVFEPKRRDVFKGRAPLSTYTLTEFADGGMILGVAISHVLTDAAGYHLILKHLSQIYDALLTGQSIPAFPYTADLGVFEFGTDSQSRGSVLDRLKKRGLPKPISIKGFAGGFVKSLIMRFMDKSLRDNPPIKIEFTADQVAKLKDTVLAESGEAWISTNTALCAHFTSIMAKLSYPDQLKYDMQVGQLLDLRGRYFKADSDAQMGYVGNAILIHIDKAKFEKGLQNTSRGELARYFKQRSAKTTAADVKTRLDLLADCLEQGFTNPELDVKNPIISLNNQSKMPAYDLTFNAQTPLRIIPQDVGDNIMFFPSASGGIEIYIRDIVNPSGQLALRQPDWNARIYDV